MPWWFAMLFIAPLMRGGAMQRTWFALFCASVAAWMVPHIPAWVFIDFTAAMVVLFPPSALRGPFGDILQRFPHPTGNQKAIAALFAVMMCFELGWLLSEHRNLSVVYDAGKAFGWVQWALLVAWVLDDRIGIGNLLAWGSRADFALNRDRG